MADQHSPILEELSRRQLLHLGIIATGGVTFGAGLSSPSGATTAKVPKQTVNYQAAPHGQARCGTCAFFQAPGSCNYVDGPISPSGWCMLYKPK